MNSFEEFATLWSKHSVGNKKRIQIIENGILG